jgi:cellulose synthase (UDP-forming)
VIGYVRNSTANRLDATHVDIFFLLWLGAFALVLYTAVIPVDTGSQLWSAGLFLAVLLFLRAFRPQGFVRVLFLFLAAFLSLRYFFWRTTSTLSYSDFLSFIAMTALYVAEVYSLIIHLLGVFVNINPLDRDSVPLLPDPQDLPTVDILIPSYNEPADLLEVTLLAAVQIRYPREKFKVYLLDDGGTQQKCHALDLQKAAAAQTRRRTLQALCQRVGAHYLTREKNDHAKAGNINAALPHIKGDLVLILDADHVPTLDILERTVGYFQRDPKLFLVQTPHFFINPTSIEKNLQTFEHMPGDNDMFYAVTQRGLDFWNASFFCGAAGLLRRKYLDEIGGLCGDTVTEDAETALALHAKGYRSVYLYRPMIAGLSPETFTGFIIQRTRWAQGMVQILLLKNPLFLKGLALWQRLGYVSSSFFWFFSYARLVFLLAPSAYLLFGCKIYDVSMREILTYTVPHLLAVVLVTDFLFGKVRWPFFSELYELLQSMFTIRGVGKVLLHPHAPQFLVTPKSEHSEQDWISPLSKPFYVLFGLIVISLVVGVQRYLALPAERPTVMLTMAWELFNLVLIMAALGALFERRQRRRTPRVPVHEQANLVINDQAVPCTITNLSVGGAEMTVPRQYQEAVHASDRAVLHVRNTPLNKHSEFHTVIRSAQPKQGRLTLGVEFTHHSLQETAEKVAFIHGDSERWLRFLEEREQPLGILRGTGFLLYLAMKYSASHAWAIIKLALHSLTPRRNKPERYDRKTREAARRPLAKPVLQRAA